MADEDFGDFNHAPRGGHGGQDSSGHVSVLLEEAIDFLAIRRGGTYIDATLGGGGHSWEIARRLGVQGHLIGFDKDPVALGMARRRLLAPPAELVLAMAAPPPPAELLDIVAPPPPVTIREAVAVPGAVGAKRAAIRWSRSISGTWASWATSAGTTSKPARAKNWNVGRIWVL